MKYCKTVTCLLNSIKKNQPVKMFVYGIMKNSFDPDGAYLNLGEGIYTYVGKNNWNLIKNYIYLKKGAKNFLTGEIG